MISWPEIFWIFAIPAIALLIYAALHDVATRTVPNWLCVAILMLGFAIRIIDGSLVFGLAIASVTFVLLFVIWCIGAIGGGDVKLWAASVLLIPPHWQPELSFFLRVILSGGALAAAYILLRFIISKPRASRTGGLIKRILRVEAWRICHRGPLPYAFAIASGAILTLVPLSVLALR